VPFVRGGLVSFPSASILEYIRLLAESGFREITLLGQNVNQYGQDSGDIPFYRLLERAAETPGLLRINFITSHPKDFDGGIIDVIRDHGNISRAVHLPLQSGSDRILALMNRQYTMASYMKIVETLDRRLESHSLSTDLIVGFPGETEEEFRMTLEAMESIRFHEAFTYAYSPREGTPAFALPETIPKAEKMDRLSALIEIQRRISRARLSDRLDRTEEIIVEGMSRRSGSEVMGKTFLNHPIVLPGEPGDIGKKLSVKVISLKGATLYGKRTA
jgi:tRNA-2-methylthio-N6-dimethylallyladenosine synthase